MKGGARPGSGRKPKDDENRIRDLMKPYSLDAIQCLANIITDETAKTSDRISASKLVIEYTYGKPKENIEQTLTLNDFKVTDLIKFKSED